ncbi:MAG: hypothetical protein M1510_14335 [Nitrospirae bacterium]|nr:hypothetical protein [Nitrospirota bacterium]MCL5236914.1 hypothetical protein [Nitrospirota bacterium]
MPENDSPRSMDEMVHKMKGSLAVLRGFFSAIDSEEDPREVLFLAKRLIPPCQRSIAAIESMLNDIYAASKGKDG